LRGGDAGVKPLGMDGLESDARGGKAGG
jgi:hypothetical protein